MKTRTSDNPDPGHAPERNLSSAHLRPINVSLALCANAVRRYPEDARCAALWLCNLAANSRRIQTAWTLRGLRDPLGTIGRIAEADLADKLNLTVPEIYRALTGDPAANLPAFTRAVLTFRAAFQNALPPLVRTGDTARIAGAFRMAAEEHSLVEVRGKWRHGKTVEAERQWLGNLDNTIWLHCPGGSDRRAFVFALAQCLGIGVGGGVKPGQLQPKIMNALGQGLIERIVVDEAAGLWPNNLRDSKPERLEFLRELRDTLAVGVVLLTTDQFALNMELALQHNTRWAPGQVLGRMPKVLLRDKHTDNEIRAIARMHAGEIDDDAVEGLLLYALSQEGYLGGMVEAIKDARQEAAGARLTAGHIAAAAKRQERDAHTRQLAGAAVPRKRGARGFALLTGGKAA
jgi:DNA transposition AAA+ family ATPase